MSKKRRILGVDPGTNVLGYAVIDGMNQSPWVVEMGVIHLKHLPTHADKLSGIYNKLMAIIENHSPDEMAIEAPFFGKNVQSMLKLGRAQGVSMVAGMNAGLSVTEYSPKKIKLAVTGNGNASKEQVAAMSASIVSRPMQNEMLDATDALAAAICHFYQGNKVDGPKRYDSWSSFIKENKNRVK